MSGSKFIEIRGARENNLKNIDIDIPKNKLVVITGPSGSGKSSLAFDTIYAEGQRRYVESLSSYARQFLNLQEKPDVDSITGLSPAIAIDQKTTSRNPRSTVATVTEIYDYLRILFSSIGKPYSPETGKLIEAQSAEDIARFILKFPAGVKIQLLAPFIKNQKGEFVKEIMDLKKKGLKTLRVNGEIFSIDPLPKLDRTRKNNLEAVIGEYVISENVLSDLEDGIKKTTEISNGLIFVKIIDNIGRDDRFKNDEIVILSTKYTCPVSGFTLAELEPRIFSFNSPFGACESCDGLGTEDNFDVQLIVPYPHLSLFDGAIEPWNRLNPRYYKQVIEGVCKHFNIDPMVPFSTLSPEHVEIIINGSKEEIEFTFYDDFRKHKVKRVFTGVIGDLIKRQNETDDDEMLKSLKGYQNLVDCRSCKGHRLKDSSLCVKIDNFHIGNVTRLTVLRSIEWFKNLPSKLTSPENEISKRIIKEILDRLGFLENVGLEYLNLGRSSATLSGGEAQRIRLASQIGSGLTGIMYVLDEPSIGLHQSDNHKLVQTLKNLRDMGNSVIVVEHDEDTMREADHVIDIGPKAGKEGGYVVAEGTVDQIKANPNSVTGKFLSHADKIDVPTARRKYGKNTSIKIFNARENNLKNIDVEIPLGMFVAITGVSGGGKSTLIIDTMYQAINNKINRSSKTPGLHDRIEGIENVDKIIEIDQSPIGRTPRSNPATYIGAFNLVRDHYTALPESKIRGYKPGRFSFNVKGGRCEKCQGDGVVKIEMHFLPDVYITCDSCNGQRYNEETLDVKYKDKSISDVLNMTSREALTFFKDIPAIKEKLASLCEVGLDYVKIGQQATTLSGGEAQRIKLAKELSKRATGNTLYILDEPTTGLHSCDIKKLLNVLHALVDNGNSMLVIEHNLDVVKTADHVIDIGPRGGEHGGMIVAHGTPEEVANTEASVTGKFLKPLLPNNGKIKESKFKMQRDGEGL